MFFSHELLTSEQHGVATVWLASTLGLDTTNRRISRKAIEGVDVAKACETIAQPPGAPLALRLQSSLLCGVSKVFHRQVNYVLVDAEKFVSQIKTFRRALGSDTTIDPQAGKASRESLMIPDDPWFIHNMDFLPPFGDENTQLVGISGRNPTRASTPWDDDLVYDSIAEKLSQPETPRGGASSQLVLPSSGFQSMGYQQENEDDLLAFNDDKEQRILDDWGLDIDAEGNVIERDEDVELPVLPRENRTQENEGVPAMDGDGDIMMLDNAPALLPSSQQQAEAEEKSECIVVTSDRAIVPHRRRRLAPPMAPDSETNIHNAVIKSWSKNYDDDQDRIREDRTRKALRAGPTPTQAKKNGFNFVFGLGIGGVGTLPPGHLLARLFAGNNLADNLLGLNLNDKENEENTSRPSRRKATEDAGVGDAARRVRPRLEEGTPILGQDNLDLEIGRKSSQALPDLPSDVPWIASSSAIKNKGKGKEVELSSQASPIRVRGSSNIDRHSDQPFFGEDTDFPLQSTQNPFAGPSGSQSQLSTKTHDTLGHEGRNFLGYVEKVVAEKGLPDADTGVTWTEFDDIVGPGRKREAAVMAFRIVLLLATRDTIKVQQADGNIRVGLKA